MTQKNNDPFLNLLEQEFETRKAANPRYSFRAFAHSLKMDAGTLHNLMRKKRKTGVRRRRQMLLALGMTEADADVFLSKNAEGEQL